jgi:Ion channel
MAQGRFVGSTLYFSLSTLTTTGFGDNAPLHPLVRSIATPRPSNRETPPPRAQLSVL